MTTSEINKLTQFCEIERTQTLTILSSAQTNPFMAGYLLTGNRSNFVCIAGVSLWLFEWYHYLSPFYTHKEKCSDRISIYYQDTIYYVDPISRQKHSFATEIACDSNPGKTIALELDGTDYYLLTPSPVKHDPPARFISSEIRSTIQSNTFSAHTAGLYSPIHIKQSWNKIFLTKHSDETIQVLGKAISYDFFHDINPTSEDNNYSLQSQWPRQIRIETMHRILKLGTVFTRNWSETMLINTLGWPYHILTKSSLYFATYQFLHFTVTAIV